MSTKYYVRPDGSYIGGFAGSVPAEDHSEVPTAPADARMVWDGEAWRMPLDVIKARLVREIDAERDTLIAAGFEFGGVLFQARDFDRANITGASTAAALALMAGAQAEDYRWHGGDTDFAWIADDNSLHVMDAPTMVAVGQAAMAHVSALVFAARVAKDAVLAAETAEAAQAARDENPLT